MKRMLVCFCFASLVLMQVAAAQAQKKAPTRGIIKITEHLYRAQNDLHHTVFLVTPEGIIMTDPLNRDFSTWLKGEMEARFHVPVRYVLYSHSHLDHASGGEVFADTAKFIAHKNFATALAAVNGPKPVSDVYMPTETFSDRKTITLGGQKVEMIHPGEEHSPDMFITYFPGESVLFTVDFVSLKQMPIQALSVDTVEGWVKEIRVVENIKAKTIVGAHGVVGTTADAAKLRQYIEELRDGVAAGIKAGSSVEQLQKSLTLDVAKDWEFYNEWRTGNIASMYSLLKGTHKNPLNIPRGERQN
jgi:glyoxylase-like metal-dependent hydrolase (beta-lactamase superfamily II)